MRIVAILSALLAVAASLEVAWGAGTSAAKEGGTFRAAVTVGLFQAMDPALYIGEELVLRPACGSLMAYPSKPLPAGRRLAPELATSNPVVSGNGRVYTFTIRADARFSTGAPVTARDFAHTLERILTPAMRSWKADYFKDIVGARQMLAGKAATIAGVVARGRTLRLRLTKPVTDFPARTSLLCAVPQSVEPDPEGAKAPLPSAAPYYVAEYVPGQRLVLDRNRHYRGRRPHHLDRVTVDLQADASSIDRIARGTLDYVAPTPDLHPRLSALARRYGVNRSRFFLGPGDTTRMFFLNTSRPLFRDNVELRKAVNLAVDRSALVREIGPFVASPTDQYLPPAMAGFRDARIYPFRPDLRRARALARGRTRSGRAVLYTCNRPDCVAPAHILQRNLKAIGLDIAIRQFPTALFFEKSSKPREPYDLIWLGWFAAYNDPQEFLGLFEGRNIGQPSTPNFSHLDVPKYNRLLARAARLTGPARYRTYGELDVQLARDAAPAISYAVENWWAFVSARTGCVVMNPYLDLTAVCLK